MPFVACRCRSSRGRERCYWSLARLFGLTICIQRLAIALRRFGATDEVSTEFVSTTNGESFGDYIDKCPNAPLAQVGFLCDK